MTRELILSSGAVNVYLAICLTRLWGSNIFECMLGNCRCPVRGFFMTWSITRIVVVFKCFCDPAPLQVMDAERTVGTFQFAGCMQEKCFVLHCLLGPEMSL